MAHQDEHLPADLQDIGARLSAARANPTGLELDELRRRAHRQARRARPAASRAGLVGPVRSKLVAVALTVGLLLTTGVGVGLAFQSFGGHDTYKTTQFWPQPPKSYYLTGGQGNNGKGYPTNPGHPTYPTYPTYPSFPHANICEYLLPHEHDYEFKTKYGFFFFFLVWDCKLLTLHFYGGYPFKWEYNNWGWNGSNSSQSYTVTPPTNASSLTVNVGGQPYTIPLNG